MIVHNGRALAAAVLVAAGVAIAAPAAEASTGAITGIGGTCLDVPGNANGTRVQLWSCTGGPAQQWTARSEGTITAASGKCLDVAGGSHADGAAVQIYDCNGTGAQLWQPQGGALVNTASGKCLDATGVSSADGTPLQLWTCTGGTNQRWTLPGGTTVPATGFCPQGPFGSPLPSGHLTAVKIRDGYNFLEGPTWDKATQSLLLTNMHDGTGEENVQPSDIMRYTPATATFTTVVPDAGSNGLALSRDGTSVLAATHDQRTVSAYNLATGVRTTVAADYQGRRFNSPNDLTEGPDGTIYFTDPDFQRADRPDEMGGKTGVFRVRDGVVSLIDDTIREPNGIELSPDGKTLYVGGNATGKIYRYPVNADGSTGPRADFASLAGTDGGTVDCAGNVYQVTYGDGLVHVYSPSGQSLGTISAGPNATNAAFGGPDGKTLYITSGTPSGGGDSGNFALYSVQLNVPGWPY
ncbi:SMP-30/gluconolactonase/LRE family protein [Amycolatopsis lexingtonensis]|uniref:SMP-30/gluconolactonase/LRE family protein n=1 Tax=Amycolatopsis lexingtonensis TaxID=218822 RepID=UPI003F6E61F9